MIKFSHYKGERLSNTAKEESTMDDREIVELFWWRNETAIAITKSKYGSRLHYLAMNILHSREDAEESVSDTYLGAWNSIPPAKPRFLFAYLAKICRFSAYNKLDRKTALKRQAEIVELTREMESCIPSPSDNHPDAEEIGKLLDAFLSNLPKEKRKVFMRRYWFEDSIADIAKRYDISESKVKVLLHRTRNDLKSFLKKEGICL